MNYVSSSLFRAIFSALVFATFWLSVAGCGPDEVRYCAPGDADCAAGCEGGCPSGQTCISGRCVDAGPDGLQCTAAGDACNPMAASSEGFLCIDWDGQGVRESMCSELCADDGSCPAGSSCFVLSSNFDTACESASDCRSDMLCVQGTCRFTACQPSECSGALDGRQACEQKYADHPSFPDGAKCVEFSNQSNFCVPAGPRQQGEQCIGVEASIEQQNYGASCAAGLACVGGTCQPVCRSDEECDGAQTCTFGQGVELGEGVGFCAHTCTPFATTSEEGGCAEGQMCEPVTSEVGHCVPTGSAPAFSECTPGAHQCEPGTLCVEYPSASGQTVARCHPICDLGATGSSDAAGQAARDASCPQSPPAHASLRLVHLNEDLGPLDVYVLGEPDALVEGFSFEAVSPAGSEAALGTWHELEPGRYRFVALAAGAPRTDPPLVDVRLDLASGAGKAIYIAPPPPDSSTQAQAVVVEAARSSQRTSGTDLRAVHLISDADAVDVIAVPMGADATDSANHLVLAEGLEFGQAARTAPVPAGELQVLVFAAGSEPDPSAALVELSGVRVDTDSSLLLRGTLDPDDSFSVERPTVIALGADPARAARGPLFSCTALPDGAYGYCQQVCQGSAADFGQDVCLGDQMGCTATDFPSRDEWLTLCAPVGQGGAGSSCDPARPYGTCAEGLYCLGYGTGVGPSPSGLLGRCTPLCEVGSDGEVDGGPNSPLGCDAYQSCKPVVYDGSYDIGQCGWECTPGDGYADQSCPHGLQSCKPVASLQEDTSGQAAPVVTEEQPFCSPSGTTGAGEPCRGRDCVAGTECMYPRSEQSDLTSTLLSPYFGASGLVPTCTPQCDPFDGDDAAVTCQAGETCLPNYPWSAEVGHCAPIEEVVQPMQPCTKPGLSCGEDSICVLYQGGQECFRLCDYLGADAQGAYEQSSCPAGLVCEPLVQDIGLCGPP